MQESVVHSALRLELVADLQGLRALSITGRRR